MASLTNTKIKDTYDGLLKTTDNDALGGTYKLITDGLGNSSGLYLGTGGRLGIGTSSPSFPLEVDGGTGDGVKIKAGNSSNDDSFLIENSSNTTLFVVDGGGNVGINESNPNEKFHVNGGTTNVVANFESTDSKAFISFKDNTTTNTDTVFLGAEGNNMSFYAGSASAERMRIDSSGVVQVRNVDSPTLQLFNTDTSLTASQVVGDIDFYQSDPSGGGVGVVSKIRSINSSSFQGDAALAFHTGTTSTLTERMRIDSSGNVGIGTSSPDTDVHIKSTSTPILTLDHDNKGSWGVGDVIGKVDYYTSDESGNAPYSTAFIQSENETGGGTLPSGALVFGTATYNAVGGAVERLRIDSSGNLGLGTSSPSGGKLHIYATNTPAKFESSGLTLYNTYTNSNGNFGFVGSGNGVASGGNANDFGIQSVNNFVFATGGSTERMRITSAGRIHFYNLLGSSATQSDVRYDTTSKEMFYNTSSERYKTEIVDLENTLDKVNSLRAVRYKDIETEQETTGLIAEEVIGIIPEVVFKKEIEGFDEPQPEGINYSDFAPFLIKAIQELKAEIETLKSQINS